MAIGTEDIVLKRKLPLDAVKKLCGRDAAEREQERLRDEEEFLQWWLAKRHKVSFIDVTSATNARTMFAAPTYMLPNGNSAPVLHSRANGRQLAALLSSFAYDMIARFRCSGTHLNWFVIEESALPTIQSVCLPAISVYGLRLAAASVRYAEMWDSQATRDSASWRSEWALTDHERLRLRCCADAISFCIYGFGWEDANLALRECDYPIEISTQDAFTSRLNPKGFWRVDKEKDPELRHTVLTLIAMHDLGGEITDCAGDRGAGLVAVMDKNDGEGWMLPDTLRLADYGLGHDDRAKEPQPVASRLGPRFYDWQLAQDPEESWRECELHARNVLGEDGFNCLVNQPAERQELAQSAVWEDRESYGVSARPKQGLLFDT